MELDSFDFVVEKRRYADVKPSGSYVYAHVRLDTFQPFYVGKGKGPRGWILGKRNPYHLRTIRKLETEGNGWAVAILVEGLSSEEAYKLENKIITKIGRENLTNLNDGGIGSNGYKPTREEIERRVEKMRGFKMPREAVERAAAAKRGIPRPPWLIELIRQKNTGMKHTPEQNLQKSLRQKGRITPGAVERMIRATSKPIICIQTGVRFPSTAEAARQMGLTRECVRDTVNGRQRSTRGFTFQYIDKEQ